MSSLKLFLLGSPRLERDGQPLKLAARKSMALLAYLATTAETHTRESLVTLLWPELEPSRARAGLRRNLSMLKKTLAGEWLVVDREIIGLDRSAGVWLDVDRFHQLLQTWQTHDHPETDLCADCLAALAEAVELYRGDFLAGFSLRDSPNFDEWQFFQTENMRQELAAALERLVRGHSAQGAYEAAIPYARRWLALDPLHEPVHCQLMRLYSQTGQLSAAVRQYQECVRILEEELGAPPDAETTTLYEHLRHRPESPQSIIVDRFTLGDRGQDLLGQGSMSAVYRGIDIQTGHSVAIKVLKPEIVAGNPDLVERFVREGEALRQLNHPNIVKMLAAVEKEGQHYLVMEYVKGGSLRSLLDKEGMLPLTQGVEIALDLADALTRAHRLEIIHRDLKPANVLLAEDGTPRLTDFGLAHISRQTVQLTQTGVVMGTAYYLSPEACQGQEIDSRADIWAFGVLLYEMLSGERPFKGETVAAAVMAIINQPVPDLASRRPDLPDALVDLVYRMLEKNPRQRIPSVRLVGAELETILRSLGDSRAIFRAASLPSPPLPTHRHNLPLQTIPFVGRETELSQLARLLAEPDGRLITILGPGGMGKTRLALEAAEAQLGNFAQGVYFVNLAPLDALEAITPTVAEALGFSFYEEDEPRQQLLDYLRQKTMLLIMDNFEHLLPPLSGGDKGGVDLVADILRTAPSVKVIATSRERLKLQNEQLFQISGIDFPDWEIAEDVLDYSAIQLFLQSARRTQPSFKLTADNLTAVVQVCRLVEGMPLAILLAAAWVEMLTPVEIAAEINQSIDFLETDWRDVPERQRSLRVVFDHSWRLLTEQEREVFQGLSVFRGGFTRPAAQEVTGASLRTLMALANKSLLQRTSTGQYGMHELLRQYAAEKLEISGEINAARDAHSAYYAEFLHQREADLEGRRQLEAIEEIEADFENARAAWNWALKQKNYAAIGQLLSSLSWFCTYRSRNQENKELFQQAREQLAPDPGDEPHLVWGRILAAEFFARPSEVDRAQIERALAIAQQYGHRGMIAVCLRIFGEIALNAGDYAETLSLYEESLAHYRNLDNSFYITSVLYELAKAYRLLGQPEEAIKFARQSLDLSREIGDKFWAARSLANTGVIALYTGNFAEAEGYLQEANTIYREMGYREGIASSNVDLGKLAFLRGDSEKAKVLAEQALEIATDIGNKHIVQSARYLPTSVMETPDEKKDEHPDEQELVPITDIPPTIDSFEVKELIGAGDMGSVYLAHDPDNGRDVAIKMGNPEARRKFDWASRGFKREAEMMAKLAHPNITEFYGYVETADSAYIVLEYIDGNDLEDILEKQEGFLPEKQVIEWMLQICDALTYMHNQKPESIIFRDMKPKNVMVDHNGKLYLIDLGITIAYQPGREQALIGTEGYSPPEQYIGYSDARSDIYALGATLHQLLTRRDPRKETPFSFHEAPPPRSLNPAISEELAAVILKAVEYKAEDRYQSAAEMKADLLACL